MRPTAKGQLQKFDLLPNVVMFKHNITVHLHFFCEKRKGGTGTLRLDARLMMDRWRSLFLCAGVNSGREAALSTAAERNVK